MDCFPSTDQEGEIEAPFSAGATDYVYPGMDSWSEQQPSGRGPVGTALGTGRTQVVNDLASARRALVSLRAEWNLPVAPSDDRIEEYLRASSAGDQ